MGMMKFSALGFGVSGAHGTPLVRTSETLALIEAAVAGGVRVFDTAPSYGAGEAERRLGMALKAFDRSDLVVCTKAGLTSHGLAGRHRDLSPDGVEASVRASLDRLGVDGVDILFLHGAAPHELDAVLLARLRALKQAGAYKMLGAAGRGPALDWALDAGWFEAIMAPVHPFLEREETAALDRAVQAGLPIMAVETAGDAPSALQMPRSLADLYPLAKRLRTTNPGRGRIATSEGLKRALARPGVVSALFTTTRKAHLDSNLTGAGLS